MALPTQARATLEELAGRARHREGSTWWEGPNDLSLRSAWCHGTAGYTHLWAAAHRLTGEDAYATLALGSAEHCWTEPTRDGYLCCGTAGQAYAMIAAYSISGESRWLERAHKLAERSLAWLGTRRSHTNSLYKGDLGIALLAEDLRHPKSAAMPLFGPEHWPPS